MTNDGYAEMLATSLLNVITYGSGSLYDVVVVSLLWSGSLYDVVMSYLTNCHGLLTFIIGIMDNG